jgi:hypothetical protein
MDARIHWKRKQQKQKALWEASQQANEIISHKSSGKTCQFDIYRNVTNIYLG